MKKQKAFTLAEVLITLGIIGVVAALTLPTLIAKYQKMVTATRVKQTYAQMQEAIKLSEVVNGDAKDWDMNLSNDPYETSRLALEKYILPYFKGLSYCDQGLGSKCGSTVSGYGYNYILNNGVSISMRATFGAESIAYKFAVIIDVNGPQKPGIHGYDTFYFWLRPDGKFLPFAYIDNIKREDILNGYTYTWIRPEKVSCKKSLGDDENERYRAGCTALLMMDGWEIKEDYPW